MATAFSSYGQVNEAGVDRKEAQASHGFVVGDVLYNAAGTWTKANANDPTTSEVVGIVSKVLDANNFTITTHGYVDGLSGLTANTMYFLSATTAGLLTSTEPTTMGYVSKPVLWADSTTSGFFINYRGMLNGETTVQAGSVLQRVVQQYDPSATQALTTTYADVDGSDYSFTPVSASSNIMYEYTMMVTAASTSTNCLLHLKLLVDGVDVTESNITLGSGNTNKLHYYSAYRQFVPSWGTTAQIMKMQAREYSSSFEGKLHQTVYMDGVSSNDLVRATLIITEYAT